jgi:hypothetical protein
VEADTASRSRESERKDAPIPGGRLRFSGPRAVECTNRSSIRFVANTESIRSWLTSTRRILSRRSWQIPWQGGSAATRYGAMWSGSRRGDSSRGWSASTGGNLSWLRGVPESDRRALSVKYRGGETAVPRIASRASSIGRAHSCKSEAHGLSPPRDAALLVEAAWTATGSTGAGETALLAGQPSFPITC